MVDGDILKWCGELPDTCHTKLWPQLDRWNLEAFFLKATS